VRKAGRQRLRAAQKPHIYAGNPDLLQRSIAANSGLIPRSQPHANHEKLHACGEPEVIGIQYGVLLNIQEYSGNLWLCYMSIYVSDTKMRIASTCYIYSSASRRGGLPNSPATLPDQGPEGDSSTKGRQTTTPSSTKPHIYTGNPGLLQRLIAANSGLIPRSQPHTNHEKLHARSEPEVMAGELAAPS
jgi:hypothetical protein